MTTADNDSPVWGLRPAGPQLGSEQWGAPPLQVVLAQAKRHASVQKLAAHYEEWESSLRAEAQERIGGFKPLQRFIEASGQGDDWQLLRKVKSAQPVMGGAMKRSASEGALTMGGDHGAQRRDGASTSSGARVHMHHAWEPLGSAPGAAGVPMHTPHEAWRGEGPATAAAGDAAAAASAASGGHPQAQQQQQQRFPRSTTAPALRDADAGSSSDAYNDPESPTELRAAAAARRARYAAAAAAGWAPGSPGGDDAGSRQLEAVAARFLQQGRAAIQTAQAAVQETATNCSQNLQTLGALFSASVGAGLGSPTSVNGSDAFGFGPLSPERSGGGGGGSQLALVPWLSSDRAAAAASAAAAAEAAATPWDLIPRYVLGGAGGSAPQLTMGDGADSDAAAAAAAAAQQQAQATAQAQQPAVYRQLAEYFDRLEDERLRRRRARQGGAYSSLREPGRSVAIVTTASLPWMTGTAVNPLLRAAYLAHEGDGSGDDSAAAAAANGASRRRVTLMLPWLNKSDQERVFPGAVTFDSPDDQEAFVREWAQKRTGLPCDFAVKFYPGRYAPEKGSILPVGDITQYIPDSEADVAVLEEPEHLNWYHHGRRWTDKFRHVVGVMHTNYLDYARREEGGDIKEALLRNINAWVCRIYCHKVIKLSDAVQPLPREDTMFVHGVSPNFLEVGRKKAAIAAEGERPFGKGAYFLGKVLWAKGYTELLDRLNEHAERRGEPIKVDVYGSGPDLDAVQEEAVRRRLPLTFNGAKDHADTSLQDYKVFINPSLSDVVATTTAEALAMGKWVVCAHHPSNEFFSRFPNCLVYRDSEEFSTCLERAMSSDPRPLTKDQLQQLTWEAATSRFLDVAELKDPAPLHEQLFDNALAAAHNLMTGLEPLRVAAGAGSNTRDAPARVTDYTPTEADVGGLFDDSKRAKRIYAKTGSPTAAAAAAAAAATGGGAALNGSSAGGAGAGAVGAVAEAVAAAEAEAEQKENRRRAAAGSGKGGGGAPLLAVSPLATGAEQRRALDLETAAADAAAAAAATASEDAPAPRRRGLWRRQRPVEADAP